VYILDRVFVFVGESHGILSSSFPSFVPVRVFKKAMKAIHVGVPRYCRALSFDNDTSTVSSHNNNSHRIPISTTTTTTVRTTTTSTRLLRKITVRSVIVAFSCAALWLQLDPPLFVAAFAPGTCTTVTTTGTAKRVLPYALRTVTTNPYRLAHSQPVPLHPHHRIDGVSLAATARETGSTAKDDDTAEWRAVLAALTLYQAAFGDVKVPQKFIVPTASPWPKPAWGLKLGKVVANIRLTGKYIHGRDKRKQALEKLGFLWAARSTPQTRAEAEDDRSNVTVEQILAALVAYRENVAPLGPVPAKYIVPDAEPWPERVRGLPLGSQLARLPMDQLPETIQAKLQDLGVMERYMPLASSGSMGAPPTAPVVSGEAYQSASNVPPTANDIRFHKVYLALRTYKDVYGDLLVPQPFAVPSKAPWPQETWGLRLGARVNAVRSQGTFVNANPDRRQALDDLGFVWSPPKEGSRRVKSREANSLPDTAIPASATTKNSLDSLLDDSTFDFGQDFMDQGGDGRDGLGGGSATAPTWGLEGGRLLPVEEAAAAAQAAAEEEYAPPRTLQESLDEATVRAMECGVIEGLTDRKRVMKGKREKAIPWFNDDFGDDFVFEDVVEALSLYKRMYTDFDNLTASEEFVVPTPNVRTGFLDDVDDDLNTFDVDASARAAAAIKQYEEEGMKDRSDDLIAAEIQRIQREIEGSNVATKTKPSKVVQSTTEWPEHLAGMKLGNIVARIRDGSLEVKHLSERKAQLDSIGFDWGDPKRFLDVPFEKAMCAMYAYYLVRGDMFVYEDFVMPEEDPWPQALAGYEIGKTVMRLRELQDFLEAYHPEKVSLLRMIDFVWFPTMALPLDPDEPELTNETLLLSALGHPDYAKMIDIPMGLPDKIVADGPFVESDNPKHWWRKWHNWDYVQNYWYQQGRRDNAFVLKGMGYPQMAKEHEAKYGPGLFTQMEETMAVLESGIEEKSLDEKKELLQTLHFYRQEMLGCTDIAAWDRNQWLADLDTEMLKIMKDSNLEIELDVDEDEGYDDEAIDGEEYIEDEDYEEEEPEEEEEDKEEFDVEDELGLSGKQ
jgi:hypothetical protein